MIIKLGEYIYEHTIIDLLDTIPSDILINIYIQIYKHERIMSSERFISHIIMYAQMNRIE